MARLDWLKQPRFYGLLGLTLVLGAGVGAAASGFWAVLYAGIDFVWETIPAALGIDHTSAWYIILIVVGGGLLVGLCQRYLGDYPKQMQEEVQAFRAHGRFDTDHIPHGMLTAFVSLTAGASLGPEASLFGLGGGLSSLVADRIKRLSNEATWTEGARRVLLVAGVIAGGATALAVAVGSGVLGAGGFFDGELYQFTWRHVLWAVPASVIGVLGGYLYTLSDRFMQGWGAQLQGKPVWRALLAGVIFAGVAVLFPLTLFSGMHTLPELQLHGQTFTGLTLLLSGVLKIMLISLLLHLGWKGGIFLPLMTGAALLGLTLTAFNPALPTLVPMVAALTGILVVTLGRPLAVLALVAVMVPVQSAAIYLVALGVAVISARLVERRAGQGAALDEAVAP